MEKPVLLLFFDLRPTRLLSVRSMLSRDQPWKMGRRTGRQVLVIARALSMRTQ